MATLKYSDKHNMVAFLKKPNESVGFTEIVDFLKGTSLRYSLSHNPTIYDSLVKQFWQTATIRTLVNEIQELVASIDNKEYTITEASVTSKLQLADATGISNLPDAEIYDGLATLGGYAGEHVPLLPTMLAGAADDQGEGSANPAEPNPTPIDPLPSTSQPPIPSTTEPPQQPSPPRQINRQETEIPQSQSPTFINVANEATTTGVGVETEGATTTTSGLDAWLDSGNIHESPLRSHEAPLHEGHTSGNAEDGLQLKELMVLVPKLVTRIDNLEKELHHTKNTYGKAVLTLVERGRKIQDIDDDPLVSLVRESMKEKAADLITNTKISASGEVVSHRARSSDKGKRYKWKTRTIDKDISTGLDAKVEVSPDRVIISSGSAGVNIGSTPVSTPIIVDVQRIENKAKARHFNFTCDDDDDDEEYSIPLKDMPQISPSITLAPVSSIMKPEDSLIMGNEELSTIPEKESDEFIKSSVEDLIPIPRESEDTSGSDSESVLPSSDDFSPIFEQKSMTFSNPLFNSNDDFTSSDDESLSDEDVLEDVKIYSSPLFEFDDKCISSDVSPLFGEVLEDIEYEDSYDSNLDESTFQVTPLSDCNEDEFFTPREDVELLLHYDPSISIVSILEGFIDEPPLEENDDLFDLESKENDWKKILYDAPIDDLITKDKVFDPGIHEKSFSLTFVKLTFEDRHYPPITFVIRIFLPYLTYSVDSSFLLSSGSEDTIFDLGISTFHFSSLKPVAYENPIVIFPFFCFCPKDKGIQGESS
ncbi:hypothetical protein Tco_0853735 [Tanacetum coccineum]